MPAASGPSGQSATRVGNGSVTRTADGAAWSGTQSGTASGGGSWYSSGQGAVVSTPGSVTAFVNRNTTVDPPGPAPSAAVPAGAAARSDQPVAATFDRQGVFDRQTQGPMQGWGMRGGGGGWRR